MNVKNIHYAIFVLWGMTLILLSIILISADRKEITVSEILKESKSNLENCEVVVANWQNKYDVADIKAKEEVRAELANILENCGNQINVAIVSLSEN